jgi:SAM-dependent methyltransferase
VIGIDLSPTMLDVAQKKARAAGVEDRCQFELADFLTFSSEYAFDFVVLMGFMDYIEEAQPVVDKAIALAKRRAMFSFPARAGILAWQRRIRYRHKTPLYMYAPDSLENLLQKHSAYDPKIARIARDYFVTVSKSI